MKRLTIALACALLLALGAFAAACGDDELTLEEYFQQVGTIQNEADARIEVVWEEFPGAFEEPAATRDFLNAGVPIHRDFVDALDDIDPPAEVEDVHNERVAAGRDLGGLAEDLAGQLADVETTSELEAVWDANEPEFEAASERFDAACLALEGIAADNGIVVNLECVE